MLWCSLFGSDLSLGMEELELHYRIKGRSNFRKIRIATMVMYLFRRPKTSVRALKILEEKKHLGVDIHDLKARTSTTLTDFQKLRSEKLWAEFSFPNNVSFSSTMVSRVGNGQLSLIFSVPHFCPFSPPLVA